MSQYMIEEYHRDRKSIVNRLLEHHRDGRVLVDYSRVP